LSTTLEVEIEAEEEEEVEGKGPSTSTTLSTAFPSKTRLTVIRRTQPTRGLELETDDWQHPGHQFVPDCLAHLDCPFHVCVSSPDLLLQVARAFFFDNRPEFQDGNNGI